MSESLPFYRLLLKSDAAFVYSHKVFSLQWLRSQYGHNQVTRLAAGSLAGMTAVMCTYPLDMIRARLAFQVAGEVFYTGIMDAFKVIFTQEGGIRALYRGIVPTMIGMAPYAGKLLVIAQYLKYPFDQILSSPNFILSSLVSTGLSFYCFDTLKTTLLESFPDVFGRPCPNNDGQVVLVIPAKLLCGGMAGAFAQTIS